MALFNRLFSSRKKNCYKGQDAVCENLFILTKKQVRVLLFRECDFRGRKLLFDSESVQKIDLADKGDLRDNSTTNKCNDKFEEVSNGYGYQYIKPCCDIGHLGEMVFGAVAMSYRGTSLKIHSLKSPSRLMCSQIFPSPRHVSRRCHSTSSQSCARSSVASCQSLEQSVRLDNSGPSSNTSTSDRLSLHSNGSDALLVCRGPRSIPLDVPLSSSTTNCNNLTPSVVGDSGFSGEQSCNSIGSVPLSFPLCCPLHEGEQVSFSCGSLYKKWLRSTSTSLEHSSTSLAGSGSTDECILKSHGRRSKLGLAIIIELPAGQEQYMELFLMEHASLIESMVWKARQSVEVAYSRHGSFVSLMFEVAMNITQWLIDMISGPLLSNHLWISLAPICDNLFSIKHSDSIKQKYSNNNYTHDSYYYSDREVCLTMSLNVLKDKCANGSVEHKLTKQHSSASLSSSFKYDNCIFDTPQTTSKSADFTFLNLTRFLRNEFSSVGVKNGYAYDDKNFMAEKYVTELCELLDCIDIKHTNFFISTLITAVLTHHLGWVNTVLPPSLKDTEKLSKLHNPCNPLWGQLTDLYGAIGHPTKVSHTIITGTNKSDLISKILNSLTYFIRCNDINRRCLTRLDIKEDNKMVDCICQQNSYIPKENYKKYEDHLREMDIAHNDTLCSKKAHSLNSKGDASEGIELQNINPSIKLLEYSNSISETANVDLDPKPPKQNGLIKRTTRLTDLYKMEPEKTQRLYPCLEELHQSEGVTPITCEPASPHALLDKVKSLGIQAVDSIPLDKEKEFQLTNAIINEKVRKLCRVPASALLYHTEASNDRLVDIHEASIQVRKAFAPKIVNMEKQMKCAPSSVCEEEDCNKKNVIFVLGDNEELVGLRKDSEPFSTVTCEDYVEQKNYEAYCNAEFRVEDVKPSTSWNSEKVISHSSTECGTLEKECELGSQKEFCRSQSVPPEGNKRELNNESAKDKSKYRYSGVKFNIQQYPQIVTNYMRSKNLELSQIQFSEKALKFNNPHYPEFDFSSCSNQVEEIEILQTPSNASELEFTSDLVVDNCDVQHAKEVLEWREKTFVRNHVPNTIIKEPQFNYCPKTEVTEHPLQKTDNTNNAMFEYEESNASEKFGLDQQYKLNQMQVLELPMPKSEPVKLDHVPINYTSSLMRGMGDRYISNMVLQGTSAPKAEWESSLRKDLSIAARCPLLDQPVDEAIAIVANTDTWEVQLLSSHTYVVDRGSSGVRVGMSQLVANMLETLLQMWKLRTPPQYCVMHIEQKLQEFCVLSQSLTELLLATEFCSMDLLTSVLQLEINDVPLLMAVASTHSPQLTQKYGLSFQ
uniref:UDENN FNIP1/2-type domain-containing protein n=1 Tax=Photinus pyralis TaxID=7054 RepID=A0A1Y1MB06_PHOPY